MARKGQYRGASGSHFGGDTEQAGNFYDVVLIISAPLHAR
jgi:hypothetical protein